MNDAPKSMCEPAGLESGVSVVICDDDDLCRFHQGVDAASDVITGVLETLGVDVWIRDGIDIKCRYLNAGNGEICEGPLSGLIGRIVDAVRARQPFRLEAM